MAYSKEDIDQYEAWQNDWPAFAEDVLGVYLDEEQKEILRSVQVNKRTSVSSGTARGKDFICAVACVCFLYLTPVFNADGTELAENTKVAMTAPTDRQVGNIMFPEVSRLYQKAQKNGFALPGGRLVAYDIRTMFQEWFLTGFKADHNNTEAWTGFHASNTMFAITEASGMPELVFDAIEGNLQGNSRILIVFNPNSSVGYAAESQKDPRWARFSLSSLTAPNVISKKTIIPGQVDYEWVLDKISIWATPILPEEVKAEEDDFLFEGQWYRPEDIFRIKVLGKFPKVPEYILVPDQWLDLAEARWKELHSGPKQRLYADDARIGLDVAGMGRDNSVETWRHDNIVSKIVTMNAAGKAEHMKLAGMANNALKGFTKSKYIIDTIGEGAGVFSRLVELGWNDKADRVFSGKFSEKAAASSGADLNDVTGQYKFANMRSYCYWAVRDWLDPKNSTGAAIPVNPNLRKALTNTRWAFNSQGRIQLEPKIDIIERIKQSPDEADSLALTFWPVVNESNFKEEHFSKEQMGFY